MKLTSEISEINRLSVGIQELNHWVIAVFDSTADGGNISLHYRHIFCNQILTITLRRKGRWNMKMISDISKFHLESYNWVPTKRSNFSRLLHPKQESMPAPVPAPGGQGLCSMCPAANIFYSRLFVCLFYWGWYYFHWTDAITYMINTQNYNTREFKEVFSPPSCTGHQWIEKEQLEGRSIAAKCLLYGPITELGFLLQSHFNSVHSLHYILNNKK